MRSNYSDAEWKTRCELAALYRILAHHRMTDHIYTHISARVPGTDEHHFLINPYGLMFHEITASSLVKIDMHGRILESGSKGPQRVNTAGFMIHSAVHMARHDISCVVHTHTAAGIAVSAQEQGLLPISQHALKFYERISYHEYEGIASDEAERARLVADLGNNKAMVLRNHGLLAAGTTVAEAFIVIYYLERACQAQVAALAGGSRLTYPPVAVRQHTAQQFAELDIADNLAIDTGGLQSYHQVGFDAAIRLIKDDAPRYDS
ncbi:L-fuculose phosphate aldolase [compost metagenome]|uniref:Class II aldolase/adducin family protein n=3 Tax=Pseudomonadota TaxID=1224 RepID=A0A643G4T9_9BURK|nr:class II aldolase [Cupriavidus necator]NOV23786.1 class II aldolase/adducin family protein [Cupriavidus necator]QOT81836.1 class II aldolase/adducin family protein [Cupriavidus basilensis]BDB30306.1 class II aldolase/adducin family protein [Cupriavidus sp. P-10]